MRKVETGGEAGSVGKPSSAGGSSDAVAATQASSPTVDAANAVATVRCAKAWAWLAGVTLVGLALDLWTKHATFLKVAGVPVDVVREQVLAITARDPRLLQTLIPRHEPVVVVPGLLDFTLVLNPGAVFGMGAGQRWFFVGFTAVAITFAVFMFAAWTRAKDRWAHVALGLLISGGLGNLYDRLVHGCVRDFIHPVPGVKYPFGLSVMGSREIWPWVSNVADLFLIVGIGMLAWFLLKGETGPGARDAAAGAKAGS